jgi:hypothetical protein
MTLAPKKSKTIRNLLRLEESKPCICDKGTPNEKTVWLLKDGKTIHRIHGPAVEWKNGDQEYFQNGKLHCENGPALMFSQILQVSENPNQVLYDFNGLIMTYDEICKIDNFSDLTLTNFSHGCHEIPMKEYYIKGRKLSQKEFINWKQSRFKKLIFNIVNKISVFSW